MVNLNTCVKGQKLRLRRGRIVTYVYSDRSSAYPHKTRTEEGHYLSYPCDGSFYAENYLDVVEILPLEATELASHPSVAWWESCPWITDRKPTKEDGKPTGWVVTKALGSSDLITTSWSKIEVGRAWIHRSDWQPPTLTDKEQAMELINNHSPEGNGIVEDDWKPTPEQWHIIRKGLEAS
jgi:hypothetical protein